MILIGESLNVISKKIGKAFKERDPKPLQEEALFQKEKGMDYIDINLGPAKKDGHELMPWVVEVVQDVVPDIPLALDTSNIGAIEAALKVYKETPQPPLGIRVALSNCASLNYPWFWTIPRAPRTTSSPTPPRHPAPSASTIST